MKVKTFHALTMQDAIRAIKEELGPDAVILSSKEVHQGGRLMSYFNKPVLEVMAAAEYDPLPAIKPAGATMPPPRPSVSLWRMSKDTFRGWDEGASIESN